MMKHFGVRTKMKLTLALFFLFSFSSPFFSLTNLKERIPTQSGEYVYYRDYSFTNETYVGIILFNSTTVSLRYFSPDVAEGAKDIELFVTLKEDAKGIEIAGERFRNPLNPADSPKANYLHTFLYDVFELRQSVNSRITENTLRHAATMEAFGGEVTVIFDSFVPIFNLRRILASGGKSVLELVAMGQVLDENDPSFSAFKGINLPKAPKGTKLDSKPAEQKVDGGFFTLSLPQDWVANPGLPNCWLLGNDGVINVDYITGDMPNDYTPFEFFCRLMLRNDMESSTDLSKILMRKDGTSLFLVQDRMLLPDGKLTRNFTSIRKIDKSTFAIMNCVILASTYEANSEYFDGIVNSFKVKNR
ncbi:MAG: hypothetical protein IIW10_01355 [Spirochaetaceae bacterium]|nr:hypothetical protein [Spirochaetaceae bacterium]